MFCSKNTTPNGTVRFYLACISETVPVQWREHTTRGQDSALCIKVSHISFCISAKDATQAGSFLFAAAREDFIETL